MNRGKYAYVGLWVKDAWGKSSCVCRIPSVPHKIQRMIVSVFISTLRLTALLLKSFRLRLHCFTLLRCTTHFDRRNPPPPPGREGLLFGWFPNQETGGRGLDSVCLGVDGHLTPAKKSSWRWRKRKEKHQIMARMGKPLMKCAAHTGIRLHYSVVRKRKTKTRKSMMRPEHWKECER